MILFVHPYECNSDFESWLIQILIYLHSVKYNPEISDLDRIRDQYLGFIKTPAIAFWSDSTFEMFELPISVDLPIHFKINEHISLGKRAEVFFQEAISLQDRLEIVASQIQLIENGITLGELDFILMDNPTTQYFHVEMSYKLYLCDSHATADLNHWVGPNKRDSLYKKWQKIRDLQLPNMYTPPGIEFLKKINIEPQELRQAIYMPLQLFLPFGKNVEVTAPFLTCIAGDWMSLNQFYKREWSEHEFFIPEKQDWFVDPEKCEIWYSLQETIRFLKAFIEIRNSPMVWIKLPNNLKLKIFVTFWE